MFDFTPITPGRVALTGSYRHALAGAEAVGDTDPQRKISVTVYVRRHAEAPAVMTAEALGTIPPQWRTRDNDQDILSSFAADPHDIAAVEDFAAAHHLSVVESSAARRSVLLRGSVADFSAAFSVQLRNYRRADGLRYRGRVGRISVPRDLAGVVEAVFGLDNRPIGRAYLQRRRPIVSRAQTPRNTYLPPQVADLYNFPAGTDGSGQCIAILAFNGQLGDTGISAKGGYDPAGVRQYFQDVLHLNAPPQIIDITVHGPGNDPGDGTDPTDSTDEVLLDLQVAGGVAPGAKLVMYFTEFTEQGWVDAIVHATTDTDNAPSIISCSYGNPENAGRQGLWTTTAIDKVNESLHVASLRNMTVCCASGDDGSNDQVGDNQAHCDFPSSSPYVLGVGGTRLESAGGRIVSETVWNDGKGSATGGGVSALFSEPDYQKFVQVPVSANPGHNVGRAVPDVSAVGDPDTGYMIFGPQNELTGPIGGTSAAAPLWAALVARLNQALGARLGFFNPILYQFLSSGVLRDIVQGNNFAYSASPGYDACTGLGSPNGTALLNALHALARTPPAHLAAISALRAVASSVSGTPDRLACMESTLAAQLLTTRAIADAVARVQFALLRAGALR